MTICSGYCRKRTYSDCESAPPPPKKPSIQAMQGDGIPVPFLELPPSPPTTNSPMDLSSPRSLLGRAREVSRDSMDLGSLPSSLEQVTHASDETASEPSPHSAHRVFTQTFGNGSSPSATDSRFPKFAQFMTSRVVEENHAK